MNRLVSVVITTHCRHETILKRAIDSVFAQTYTNFEIIVVDDAKEYERHNEILDLVGQYTEKLRYIINEKRPSACVSRNIGIQNANGEILALLDDDDEWLPDKLEIMVPLLDDDTVIVYGDFNIINSGKSVLYKKKTYSGMIFKELLSYGNFIGGCSVPVMDMRSVVEAGAFDENLKSAQDYDLWLRLAKIKFVKYVEKPCVNYYISGDAISSSPQKRLNSSKYLLQKYSKDFDDNPEAKKRIVDDVMYYLYLNGDFKTAKCFAKEYNCKKGFISSVMMILKSQIKRILLKFKLQNR